MAQRTLKARAPHMSSTARTVEGKVLAQRAFTFGPYSVHKFTPGESFNIKEAPGGVDYSLTVLEGAISSTQAGGSVY